MPHRADASWGCWWWKARTIPRSRSSRPRAPTASWANSSCAETLSAQLEFAQLAVGARGREERLLGIVLAFHHQQPQLASARCGIPHPHRANRVGEELHSELGGAVFRAGH